MITPVAISTIGYQYYIVFTIIGFCIPMSVYFLYPEVSIHNCIWPSLSVSIHKLTGGLTLKTMGLRLEEIDLIFRESPSVMKTVAYARNRVSSTDEEILEKDKHEHKEVA